MKQSYNFGIDSPNKTIIETGIVRIVCLKGICLELGERKKL